MPEEPDPPRQHYGFKDREFKRDNALTPAHQPTMQDLAKMSGDPVRSSVPSPTQKADDPNDVYAVLQHNRQVAQQFGGDEVELTTTGSRRKRDYWLVFIPLEIVFGGVVAFGIKQGNPFFLVFGLTGMVVFGIAITWIMWQLVDRY